MNKKTGKTNKKNNNKRITEFFPKGQLSNDIVIEANPADTVSEFYTNCAEDRLKRDNCTRSCAHEFQKVKQQLACSKDKLEQIKVAIDTCNRIIERKDQKIQLLKEQMNEQTVEHRKEQLFSSYENDFTCAGLSELRSIGGKRTEDSKFVLAGMRFLYEGQLHRLDNISVTGGSKNKNKGNVKANVKANEKMSPKKLNVMKGAFTQRLDALKLDGKEHKQREARINIHVNNAIQNLNSKKNSKQELNNLNDQLNLTEN